MLIYDSCVTVPGGFATIYKVDNGYSLVGYKMSTNTGMPGKKDKVDHMLGDDPTLEEQQRLLQLCNEKPAGTVFVNLGTFRNRRDAAAARSRTRLG